MAEEITPHLGLTKAVPGTHEPFSTAKFNANLDKLDAETLRLSGFANNVRIVTDLDALEALADTSGGQVVAVRLLGGALFVRNHGNTGWNQQTPARVNKASRDTEYAKAGGKYLADGAQAYRWDRGYLEQYMAAGIGGTATAGWYPADRQPPGSQYKLRAKGSNSNTITGGAFAPIPGTDVIVEVDLPKPAWFDLYAKAWMTLTGTADLRGGINVSGATTSPPQGPGSDWSEVMYLNQSYTGTIASNGVAHKALLLGAGKTFVQFAAYKQGAGTAQLSYPSIEAIFRGYEAGAD